MAEPPDQPLPLEFQIEVPPETEAGVYADFASLWFTGDSFVLDFVTSKSPPQLIQDPDGQPHAVMPMKVVARVRVPPAQVFEIASKLTQTLTQWEEQTGRRPPTQGNDGQLPPI